jgi:endoglucanase
MNIKPIEKALVVLASIFFPLMATGQSGSPFIIVDQFGYLPNAPKIAVIKDPRVGFDSVNSFSPGKLYALVDAVTGERVHTGSPVSWMNGMTDPSSGDRVWHFDFSEVKRQGTFFVVDVENDVRSFRFNISPSVYNEVLRQAMRTNFYQRSGFPKEEPYAEAAWADGASHIGPGQDKNARLFSDRENPATERDVSGGWYDAGDYNKYTNWNANYVILMMLAYLERPEAWTDDYNIPESGNGIPDILDEAKWGLEHLMRMQGEDGGVLSVVGASHASPPSAASGQTLYGPPNTSATLNTAAAFALASGVYGSMGMDEFSGALAERAGMAWAWAEIYPDSLFRNNDHDYGSRGLAAGQQEVSDFGRLMAKLRAACFLFGLTGNEKYHRFFYENYNRTNLIARNTADPFSGDHQDFLLYYTTLEGAIPSVADEIRQAYINAMLSGSENWPAVTGKKDPYMSHINRYSWGSNSTKSVQGNMYINLHQYNLDVLDSASLAGAAAGYINYIQGVNPLNFNYLSNMFRFGADHGVREFYHAWFTDGSPLWDRVGVSTYGPAPGFLTGGANPRYDWDNCCPDGCRTEANNQLCFSESISPPRDQPDQKSYKDFNTSWPLNSWEISENQLKYQLNYIRLLSKFVNPEYDCNGDLHGNAFYDACGICVGGNTGRTPQDIPGNCEIWVLTLAADNGSVSGGQSGEIYSNGEMVTLTAVPGSGYRFDGWNGDAGGYDNPLAVAMNCDKQIIARFVKIK